MYLNFKEIGLILKKELSDLFRDKKTMMTSLLVPLIIFPLMFYFMNSAIQNIVKKEEYKIAVNDKSNSSIIEFLNTKDDLNISIMEKEKAEEKVKEGEYLVYINIPDKFEESVKDNKGVDIEVMYDNSSQTSNMAYSKVNQYIMEFSKEIVAKNLNAKGIDLSILTPISVKENSIVEDEKGAGMMIMSMIIPLFIVLYCVTGPMPAAIDLGAGEKERGTLEPLLTTKVGRMSILYGKLFAVTIMGILTAAAAIIGLIISIKINPEMFGGGDGAGAVGMMLSAKSIIIIFIFTVLTSMIFGALQLAISIYARSFKEAQTYTTPLTILAIIPTFLMYMVDIKNIDMIYFHIPIANVMAILKEVTLGVINIQHIMIVFGWSIVYIAISIFVTRHMFNKENVIFRT
ncbi:ABC transporter permease [Clostridium ihumii]|uniref:ABC transporter permease n=1 Tax=Clostridium ihumii TaxID=1470356 RepID=UPI0005577930|nr:ABC transporter permease [Clostridium ihumii]